MQRPAEPENITDGLLDFVYPKYCVGCKMPSNIWLCQNCIEKFVLIEPPVCHNCGINCNTYICSDCRVREYWFDSAKSASVFDGPMHEALCAFKFKKIKSLLEHLSSVMISQYPKLYPKLDVDLVIPLPIDKTRFAERGFNQSELLAGDMCGEFNLKLDTSILRKKRKTIDQTQVSHEARLTNLNGAFTVDCAQKIRNKSLLLVDDVFTTGSTLNEAAKTLKESGASKVFAYTLARRF